MNFEGAMIALMTNTNPAEGLQGYSFKRIKSTAIVSVFRRIWTNTTYARPARRLSINL